MFPVVRAGDVVRLWSREEDVRIEVAAMAEESGGLGKTVRVRLMPRNNAGPAARRAIARRGSWTP